MIGLCPVATSLPSRGGIRGPRRGRSPPGAAAPGEKWGHAQRVGCWGRRRRSRGRRRCYDDLHSTARRSWRRALSALPQMRLGRAWPHEGHASAARPPPHAGGCADGAACEAARRPWRRPPPRSPHGGRGRAPVAPSLPPPATQTLARRARPAPGAARGRPCYRRLVPTAASAADPSRPSILLKAPRRVAVHRCGGARRRRLLDGRCVRPCCARPPSSTVSSSAFPPSRPLGTGVRCAAALAQRRRVRPVRPCLFYYFSSRARKQPTLGVSA